jgi:hypothetical protein
MNKKKQRPPMVATNIENHHKYADPTPDEAARLARAAAQLQRDEQVRALGASLHTAYREFSRTSESAALDVCAGLVTAGAPLLGLSPVTVRVPESQASGTALQVMYTTILDAANLRQTVTLHLDSSPAELSDALSLFLRLCSLAHDHQRDGIPF